MRLGAGAKVAVIGAGPGGLAAAKHAIQAGYEVTVFEAGNDLGGQWNTAAPHSGIWPGMRTNTSRAMTAFSDYPAPGTHALHPLAKQIHEYLRSYADEFGVTDRIRFAAEVLDVRPGWRVNGEAFDGAVVASGRFHAPVLPSGSGPLHRRGAARLRLSGGGTFPDRRVLVYGNGVSGHEIASDIATVTPVSLPTASPATSCRRTSTGSRPTGSGTPTSARCGARRCRRTSTGDDAQRVLRVAGNPADFGAPQPDANFLVAGHSLCQDYLAQVRAGEIRCRPAIASVAADRIISPTARERVEDRLRHRLSPRHAIPVQRTLVGARTRPAPASANNASRSTGIRRRRAIRAQGPYCRCSIAGPLDRRRVVRRVPPDEDAARASLASLRPPSNTHNILALALSEAVSVAPDMTSPPRSGRAAAVRSDAAASISPDGPGARADAAATLRDQLAASPRAPVEPDDIAALPDVGFGDLLPAIKRRAAGAHGGHC